MLGFDQIRLSPVFFSPRQQNAANAIKEVRDSTIADCRANIAHSWNVVLSEGIEECKSQTAPGKDGEKWDSKCAAACPKRKKPRINEYQKEENSLYGDIRNDCNLLGAAHSTNESYTDPVDRS